MIKTSNNDVHGEVGLSNHHVVASGPFGIVSWNVCDKLYAILPREKRDALLEMTGDRVIGPYFKGLTERLLTQAGCGTVDVKALDGMWSLETQSVTCAFGCVGWTVSLGLWDTLPPDQRDSLCEFALGLIHNFFTEEVLAPLYSYAYRQLHG